MELVTKIFIIINLLCLVIFYAIIFSKIFIFEKVISSYEDKVDEIMAKKNKIISIREDIITVDKEIEEIYENTVHNISDLSSKKH